MKRMYVYALIFMLSCVFCGCKDRYIDDFISMNKIESEVKEVSDCLVFVNSGTLLAAHDSKILLVPVPCSLREEENESEYFEDH